MRLLAVLSLVLTVVIALESGPAVASAQGTPAPVGVSAGEPGSLTAMLGQLPAAPLDQISGTMVTYANYAAQLDAVGITMPETVDEAAIRQWASATTGLTMIDSPQGLFWPEYQKEWREEFGFNLAQIDQVVQLSEPFRLTLMRGRFDAAELMTAWEYTGYETRNIGGAAVAVLPEDSAIDLLRVGASFSMRHAAILNDGTLVFTETGEGMAAVFAVADGRAPALSEQVEVATLLSEARPDLVSALLLAGGWLQHDPLMMMMPGAGEDATPGVPDFDAMATQTALQIAEAQRLQPVRAALFGMTAGGPLHPHGMDTTPIPMAPGQVAARFEIAVLMTTRRGAERAVPVIEERLASGQTWAGEPYAELFPERTVNTVPDTRVVLIELSLGEGTSPSILIRMMVRREPGFLAW